MKPQSIILTIIVIHMTIAIAYSWPIPDTGQTKCYDNKNEIPCPNPGEPFYGQDGNYIINPKSYTKLDEKGNELPDDATSWVMIRDNVTGLTQEHKKFVLSPLGDAQPCFSTFVWGIFAVIYDTSMFCS